MSCRRSIAMPRDVRGARDERELARRRRPRLSVVKGERAEDALVAPEDRRRPAGPKPGFAREVAVVVPERVGLDVLDDDSAPAKRRGPARSRLGSDGSADDPADVALGQAGRRARSRDPPGRVEEQDRRERGRRVIFDRDREGVQRRAERRALGDHLEEALLVGLHAPRLRLFGDVFDRHAHAPPGERERFEGERAVRDASGRANSAPTASCT